MTDLDGRCSTLLNAEHVLSVGTYKVHFDTKTYFDALGVKGFYPYVDVSLPRLPLGCLDHHLILLIVTTDCIHNGGTVRALSYSTTAQSLWLLNIQRELAS